MEVAHQDKVRNIPDQSADNSKRPRISYDLTKSFAHSQYPDHPEKYEKKNEELILTGDVRILNQILGTKEIFCVAYVENFGLIAAGSSDGVVRLFDVKSGEHVMSLRDFEIEQYASPTTAIKHRPTGDGRSIRKTLMCSHCNGCVKCWHYPSSQCLYTIREKRQILGLSYHPRLPKFVTFGDDTKLILYDEETRKQERVFHSSGTLDLMNGHNSRIFCACFLPTSDYEFVSGGWDNTIQFWDIRQPHSSGHLGPVHICGEGIDIDNGGKKILTCAWQEKESIQLWDYSSRRLINTLDPDIFISHLYCGKFINESLIVCGGTEQNYLRIVNIFTNITIAGVSKLPGGIYSLDVGPWPSKQMNRSRKRDASDWKRISFCSDNSIYEIELI